MLRISEERLGEKIVVHVAGRLTGESVEELGRVCIDAPRPLQIELAGLLQADEMGLSLLRSLRESGVELAGVSPFIDLLLKGRKALAEN